LAEWPKQHFGYRQQEVREALMLLDEAISGLRAAAGMTTFDVSLVAMAPDVELEPVAGMPSIREQVTEVFRVAAMAQRASERVPLLQAALALLDEAAGAMPAAEIATLRRSTEMQIRDERAIDAQYSALA